MADEKRFRVSADAKPGEFLSWRERREASASRKQEHLNRIEAWSAYLSVGTKAIVVVTCTLAFWTPAFDRVLKLLETMGSVGWNAGITIAAAIVGSRIALAFPLRRRLRED